MRKRDMGNQLRNLIAKWDKMGTGGVEQAYMDSDGRCYSMYKTDEIPENVLLQLIHITDEKVQETGRYCIRRENNLVGVIVGVVK